MKVCFIGHRNIFENIESRLKETVENEIKNGADYFAMGTHGKFDTMALNVCRDLRQTYKDIKIEVVLTSLCTPKKWLLYDDEFGKEYFEPYKDVQTIMYNIEQEHFKRRIVVSNKNMIDSCDILIYYVNKKHNPSGAKTAMNYAKRKGLKIINLYNENDCLCLNPLSQDLEEFLNEKQT